MRTCLITLLIGLCATQAAFASLGELDNSVDQDGRNLRAVHTKSPGDSYTIHELKTSTVSVKEYVSASGVVFAVTWRGMKRPDLSQLFGSYYEEYVAKDSEISSAGSSLKAKGGRRSTVVKTSKIVVSRGGHMRDIHGKAYVPDLVPAGVNVEGL